MGILKLKSIRFKLSAVIFLLLALVTTASSVIVMNIMDRFILEELIKSGFSMSRSAATTAGYNMLSGDTLALDNLTAKLHEFEKNVLFAAAVDLDGMIKAHSTIGRAGRPFSKVEGEVLRTTEDGSTVRRVVRASVENFEFHVPIIFAGKKLGDIYLALDAHNLMVSQRNARRKILLVSALVMVLGSMGTFYLSAFITRPIKRLSEGVSQLSSDRYREKIPVFTGDELGELTGNFNAMAETITRQKAELKQKARELEEAYISTVKLLATAIDARDNYTLGHSTRVGRMSVFLGHRLGLSEEMLRDLEIGCMFHDVGKIRTPDSILNKQGPLNEVEYVTMMQHTKDGAEILRVVDSLRKHIPAVLYHHEWHDGTGYPEGLKGDEIPLLAAIISIADSYDAMTSARPYREAMSKGDAIRELRKFRGSQFDPHITDSFIEMLTEQKDTGEIRTLFIGNEP